VEASSQQVKSESKGGGHCYIGKQEKNERNSQPGREGGKSEGFTMEFATVNPESDMIIHQRSFKIFQLSPSK